MLISHGNFENIPFLYQAKIKFTILTFDSYISLVQPTAIFFAYCLWPASNTSISDVIIFFLVQQLLCFVYGLELLQCFWALMAVHVMLVHLQTSMILQVERRTHEAARHTVFECQVAYSISDKGFNHSLCRYKWDTKRLWCTSVFSLLRFCIEWSSICQIYPAHTFVIGVYLRTWNSFFRCCCFNPLLNCTHLLNSNKVQC